MAPLAAREGDHHTCPMVTGSVPHVGGPILPTGGSVLIENKPVALVTEKATCVGPVDTLLIGCPTVLVDGLNVTRLGDSSIHGGVIDSSCATVFVGQMVLGVSESDFLAQLKEPLTPEQAAILFYLLSNQQYISFGYPRDGCYARAELMARMMRNMGLAPDKAWTFADRATGDLLRVKTSNVPEGYVEWTYHVAPTVQGTDENGRSQTLVMDPSMFEQPVTLEQWVGAQENVGAYMTTEYGESPIKASKGVTASGYWPGPDPEEGVDNNALETMELYKPQEGK